MDATGFAFAIAGVAVGWWLRASLEEPKVDKTPTCSCLCNWAGTPPPESTNSNNSQYLLAFIVSVSLAIVLVLGNVALAFKISLKDEKGGSDREFHFQVKGKSNWELWEQAEGCLSLVRHLPVFFWKIAKAFQPGQLMYVNYGEAPPAFPYKTYPGTRS